MDEISVRPPEFWDTVADHVSAKVEPLLNQGTRARKPVITYLRDLEAVARRECSSRETVQVIASARRVLGDRGDIGPADGPFSRT